MRHEQDVKVGKAKPVCSVTGLLCRGKCTTAQGCGGRLDDVPEEAVRWARSALCRVDIVEGDIERAAEACLSERGYPGPELREAAALARRLRTQLEQCLT